jgi:hypothetical protein
MSTEFPGNAEIRAKLLTQYEAELKKMFPDESHAPIPFSFDAIEAAAVRTGDEAARTLMTQALSESMLLPKCTKQGRCKCGRNLQWSEKERTIETVRGPVTTNRRHGYCRVCERGFFPLGRNAAAARTPPKPPAAAGAERNGQRRGVPGRRGAA